MNYNIGGWLAAVVLLILLVLSVRGCMDEQGIAQRTQQLLEAARQDSITVEKRERESNRVVDSFKLENTRLARAVDSLNKKRDTVSRELAKTKTRVQYLVSQINSAGADNDTVRLVINCDSLADENMGLIGLVSEYETYTDSVVKMYDEQLKGKDSIIAERERLYAALRQDFNRVHGNYVNSLLERTKPKVNAWNRWIKPTATFIAGAFIGSKIKN